MFTESALDGQMTDHAEGDSMWKHHAVKANCMIYVQ